METDNDLPLPKFRRDRNKFGQEFGPYKVKVGKKKVSLKTESYIVARERAKEAFYDGKTMWEDVQRFYDAATNSESKPATPAADWAADLAGAASSAKPDMYIYPDGKDHVPLLGSVPHTEDESAPKPTDAPKTDGGESTKIPLEMFGDMMETAASILVEGQLRGQEWIIAKYAKRKAGAVAMSDTSRTAAIEFWKQQLAEWIPQDVPLPKWASAMVVVGTFGLMTQLQNSEPMPPKDAPTV